MRGFTYEYSETVDTGRYFSAYTYAEYATTDALISFNHVGVDPAKRGHGIASTLTQASLDDMRASSRLPVRPLCSFVRSYIQKHPDYQALLEPRAAESSPTN